jgi:ketosteroid isomerase-like protein
MSTAERDLQKDVHNCMARLDIIDLFARYCHAVDGCDWRLLRTVFTDDVHADYSSIAKYTPSDRTKLDGIEELVKFFETVQPPIGKGLTHFMTNHLIELHGDTATVTVHNHVLNVAQGGVYHTHARRTAQGWRLDKLVFENRFFAEVAKKMNDSMMKIDGRSVM